MSATSRMGRAGIEPATRCSKGGPLSFQRFGFKQEFEHPAVAPPARRIVFRRPTRRALADTKRLLAHSGTV